MSGAFSLFVIVEGKDHDRYLAQRLCDGSDALNKRGCEIRTVGQILGDTELGGKSVVLSVFERAKATRKLSQSNSHGRRAVAFFLDRDAEHVVGGRKRSAHVIYSDHADAEAQAFHESDEVGALANGASLDRQTSMDLLRAIGDWKVDLADAWRPWIELCYIAEATRARCWVGFGHETSRIHDGSMCRTLNASALASAEKAVSDSTLLSRDDFNTVRAVVLAKIDRAYKRGTQSSLLKGKWLPRQLSEVMKKQAADSKVTWNSRGFRESITRCYLAHLDVKRDSNRRLIAKLESLIG